MADLFISYAREDVEIVKKLASCFEAEGYSVWWDNRMTYGRSYDDEIEEQLDSASCVIVLWSAVSANSEWVKAEAFAALANKTLTPVFVESDVKVPIRLRRIHTGSLVAWEGDRGDENFLSLLRHVQSVVRGQDPTEVASPAIGKTARKVPGRKIEDESEPKPVTENSLSGALTIAGIDLVPIRKGTFRMGSESGAADERPVRSVRISRDFWMGVTPVTQAQWIELMGTNPSRFDSNPQNPVERVSWNDSQEFLKKLNDALGNWRAIDPDERNLEGYVFRLPTEAEWEYGCRAGTTGPFSCEASELGDHAWYRENSNETTHPVAKKKPNPWGLHDMHGNVWEWCHDWYGDYPDKSNPVDDPAGPTEGSFRVIRGGSWLNGAEDCRSSNRLRNDPDSRYDGIGFRVVLAPAL